MEKDSGHKLTELKVDGGMSDSDLCMQTQADIVRIPIIRPKMRETTALGAAIAAGLAAGVWKNLDSLRTINTSGQNTFDAQISAAASAKMFRRWEKAVSMSVGWLAEEAEEEKDTEHVSAAEKLKQTLEHEGMA